MTSASKASFCTLWVFRIAFSLAEKSHSFSYLFMSSSSSLINSFLRCYPEVVEKNTLTLIDVDSFGTLLLIFPPVVGKSKGGGASFGDELEDVGFYQLSEHCYSL
jgi:hypothetical protein